MLKPLLSGLLDLVAPPRCAACRAALAERGAGFCDACAPLLEPIAPRAGASDLDACLYGGPLRDAVQRLKYEGAREVAPALVGLLAGPARQFAGRVDCVTMIPLHPRRLRERGYNQSALLARPTARALSVTFLPWLLSRVSDTPAQVGSGQRARRAQLAGAFHARTAVRGRACLVIDDVRTTGATLSEARRALLAAGAREVCTLALARAPHAEENPSDAG